MRNVGNERSLLLQVLQQQKQGIGQPSQLDQRLSSRATIANKCINDFVLAFDRSLGFGKQSFGLGKIVGLHRVPHADPGPYASFASLV
jgi:hypothetical protein